MKRSSHRLNSQNLLHLLRMTLISDQLTRYTETEILEQPSDMKHHAAHPTKPFSSCKSTRASTKISDRRTETNYP